MDRFRFLASVGFAPSPEPRHDRRFLHGFAALEPSPHSASGDSAWKILTGSSDRTPSALWDQVRGNWRGRRGCPPFRRARRMCSLGDPRSLHDSAFAVHGDRSTIRKCAGWARTPVVRIGHPASRSRTHGVRRAKPVGLARLHRGACTAQESPQKSGWLLKTQRLTTVDGKFSPRLRIDSQPSTGCSGEFMYPLVLRGWLGFSEGARCNDADSGEAPCQCKT